MNELRSFRPGNPLTQDFIRFGHKHRSNFPYLIQPFKGEEEDLLNRIASISNANAWISYSGTSPQGRIVAMINEAIPFAEGKLGLLGFFEVINNEAVTHQLFDEGLKWLKEQGCTHCWAPMDYSIWNAYRFTTSHFEGTPFPGEPRNPPWYPEFCRSYGFTTLKHWDSLWVEKRELKKMHENLKEVHELYLKAGYSFSRIMDVPTNTYLPEVYKLSMEAFKGQLGYYPIDYSEFSSLFESLSSVLDPDYSIFLRSPRQKIIGYVVCQRALGKAIQRMKGRKDPLAILRYMVNKQDKGYANLSHAVLLYNEKKLAWIEGQERFGKKLSPMAAAYFHLIDKLLASDYKGFMYTMMASDSRARAFPGGQASDRRRYELYQIKVNSNV